MGPAFAAAWPGAKIAGMATTLLSQSNILPTGAARPLVDRYGRHISYLRVSVTDRCDFRCVYCMSEQMTFLPKKDVLAVFRE